MLWVVSPIDLLPEFLPVIGPLDDVVAVVLLLRYAARSVPRPVLLAAWPAEPRLLERVLTAAAHPAPSIPLAGRGERAGHPRETAMLLGGVLAFTGRASVVVMMACAAVGAVIWAPGFVYLGFLAGHSYQRVERAAGRAGRLLAAGLVLLAAVTLTARWVIRHPDRALAPGRRLRARPGVARLERRHAGQLQFLARRFDPAGALGLALTALVAALGLLGAGFGAVTEDVLAGEELVRVDSPVSRFLLEHREAWLTTFMEVVTRLGSAVVLVPVLITLGLIARWARGRGDRPRSSLSPSVGRPCPVS